MTIHDLEDGAPVWSRVGKHGEESIVWGPWKMHRLYVQKHKGKTVLVVVGGYWSLPEFTANDLCPDPEGAQFVKDHGILQVKGLEV